MKKTIAIVTGGDSSELVISLKSAREVLRFVDTERYNPFITYIREDDWHVRNPTNEDQKYPINRENFSFDMDGKMHRFDFAFIAIHGPPGEDGQLQAYLDKLEIPYSTSGARSLELSFDKYACKEMLSGSGIRTAESVLIRKDDKKSPALSAIYRNESIAYDRDSILDKLGLPCFIKPNAGGSSFGVSRIKRAEEFNVALQKALQEDNDVLAESFISGNELTCGVLKLPSQNFIFPVTEVISKNEFFDYEAKYNPDKADEVTPADIPEILAKKCQDISSKIYDLLDCRGVVRIDFINRDGELYFLELNGVPGMSRESIIPKQIRTLGYTEYDIYNRIIEETAGW